MPAHYFHCTDGFDLVLDRHGCDLEDEGEVRRMAARTAIELMQRLPRYKGWTSWLVSVHDEDGFRGRVPGNRYGVVHGLPSGTGERPCAAGTRHIPLANGAMHCVQLTGAQSIPQRAGSRQGVAGGRPY